MPNYDCKGTVLIEYTIKANSPEDAEAAMTDLLFNEYAELDWIVDVTECKLGK